PNLVPHWSSTTLYPVYHPYLHTVHYRLTLPAPLHQRLHSRHLRRRERLVEVDVQLRARAGKRVGEQQLGVEARRLHPLVRQPVARPGQEGAHGPTLRHHGFRADTTRSTPWASRCARQSRSPPRSRSAITLATCDGSHSCA